MKKPIMIEIKMLVESRLSLEEFNIKFIDWIEFHNGLCAGSMKEISDNKSNIENNWSLHRISIWCKVIIKLKVFPEIKVWDSGVSNTNNFEHVSVIDYKCRILQ